MDAKINGLAAFSYTWNKLRDDECSKIQAFARAVRAISVGVRVTSDDLRLMQQGHPTSIFARAIAKDTTLEKLLYSDPDSLDSYSQERAPLISPDSPSIVEFQDMPEIKENKRTVPLEKYNQLPEPGDITTIELHKYDFKSKEGKTDFYDNFRDYIFTGESQLSEEVLRPLGKMQTQGIEAKHFKLTGRGGVVDGRHFVEVVLDNGHPFLMYRSTGTGTSQDTLGEWMPIPGWLDPLVKPLWFIKYENIDRSDSKIDKYKILIFQQIDVFLKEREHVLFPDLNKKDSSAGK